MEKVKESAMLSAFRLLSDKERSMVFALIQRCANDKKTKSEKVHVVIGSSLSRR